MKRLACWTGLVALAGVATFVVFLSVKRIAFLVERGGFDWRGGCEPSPYALVDCVPAPLEFFVAWTVELVTLAIVLAACRWLWRSARHANPAS